MKEQLKIPEGLIVQLNETGLYPTDLVFYINSRCNLRCKHCYIGDDLLNLNLSYNLDDAIGFVNSFQYLDRITILGGEPFLYPKFDQFLNSLNLEKIKEVRVTTNLTAIEICSAFSQAVKQKLTLSVSVDGHNSEIHEFIRGKKTFQKTIENIQLMIARGYNVEITHTITTTNINSFNDFIDLAKSLGVTNLNLHRMSLHGNAISNHHLQVSPTEYVNLCSKIKKIKKNHGQITLRYPYLFADEAFYKDLVSNRSYKAHINKSYYSEGHRVVIYSNRQVYISSEFFGTDSYIGHFDDAGFYPNRSNRNEMIFLKDEGKSLADLNENLKGDSNYPYVLSVSYKNTLTI